MGLIPFAPGTMGTLSGIPVFILFSLCGLWGYLGLLVLLVLGAVYISSRAETIYGRHDDRRIVIDETAGFAVTMIGMPVSPAAIILGFLLFRFFDILKPWPCSAIDRLVQGGVGVVMDDIAAGIYALITLEVIAYFWPGFF